MNETYYDILEINQNASPEIVEKAYKTLAKKYHPDLQEESLKKESEEKLKQINEAYEVLSNPDKRKEYDMQLSFSQPNTDELLNENETLKNELNRMKNNSNSNTNINTTATSHTNSTNYDSELKNRERELQYRQELEYARQKAYHDAYIQDLKNRGYKIRYKKTFKDYVRSFVALLITIFILYLLWHIPFVHNFIVSIYNENPIIHALVSPLLSLFH